MHFLSDPILSERAATYIIVNIFIYTERAATTKIDTKKQW